METLTMDQVDAKLGDLNAFIQYLIDTDESEWQVDVVRNVGNTKNCLFGHLVNFVYGRDYDGSISNAWDYFEEVWSTDFFIYQINDGTNPDYQQTTPKQRCIAYLANLWLGMEIPTWCAMEAHFESQPRGGLVQ